MTRRERWIGRAVDPANTGFLGGWVVSERGGTANFDHPNPMAGIQLVGRPDTSGDTLVLNGEKHWSCNSGGWDCAAPTSTSASCARTSRRAAAMP